MTQIASTATVDKAAQLGADVCIGPGCVIGPHAVIGEGSELKANVVITGRVTLGRQNRLFANCVLGEEPQRLGSHDTDGELVIGHHNTFREGVTIHPGSPVGDGKSIIGSHNYLMIGAHLGHDCHLEDNIVISNYTQISGHNKIEKNAWLSALCGTHQFVTIGRFAYVAGMSAIAHDVPPFLKVAGSYPCKIRGLNAIGLQRAGFSTDSIAALEKAYRRLYRRRGAATLAQAIDELANQEPLDKNVRYLLDALRRSSAHKLGRYRELARR